MLLFGDAAFQQAYFMIQHFVQTGFSYIAAIGFFPINGITKIFIVGRNGFGNGTRSTSHAKKVTRHFLTGTDLGKSSVNMLIEIDS